MIFDPPHEGASPTVTSSILPPVNVAIMLRTCAIEAERLAQSLAAIDHGIGVMLGHGTSGSDMSPVTRLSPLLQSIDLLRQEAVGLARLLDLIAQDGSPDRILDTEHLTAALQLQSQRARLHDSISQEP